MVPQELTGSRPWPSSFLHRVAYRGTTASVVFGSSFGSLLRWLFWNVRVPRYPLKRYCSNGLCFTIRICRALLVLFLRSQLVSKLSVRHDGERHNIISSDNMCRPICRHRCCIPRFWVPLHLCCHTFPVTHNAQYDPPVRGSHLMQRHKSRKWQAKRTRVTSL